MKPTAIMVDIDGTIAHRLDRSPFDWKKVGQDAPDFAITNIIKHYPNVVLMSGRDEVCRPETEEWLERHKITYTELHMRPEKDNRKDSVVKWELYLKHVEPNWDILFVLDDRDQVVKMWRENGLKCLQVAEGNF